MAFKAKNDLFSTDSLLSISLIMDLDSVLSDIKEERKYHNATLIFEKTKIKVRVKTRGNMRRDPEICDFPPLSIEIDSLSSIKTPFVTLKKLILVTHCQKNDKEYEQMVLEEYGIYKTYNLITDKSLKVRLAKIKYQDSKNAKHQSEKLAFFVEHFKDMEKRLGGKMAAENDTIRYEACNSFLMTQAAVFQFMIGNTDWSMSNKHNIEALKCKDKMPIPILFDFDFSGLINAPYSAPTPELKLKSVTERLYRGYCQSEAEFYWVLDKFKNDEKAILTFWDSLPYHEEKRKKKAKKYISEFYQIIKNKDSIQHYFLNNCR